tara:strand:+ start:235 stop:1398 length:1164 start_codon:yes stop_codon:yes gene_type:complete
MIPYGCQDISDDDIDSVLKVLKSSFLTQGPKVPEFEDALKTYSGAKYAIAVNSATSALHIACLALGLEKGDYLWTSPNTFVASSNAGLYCGANIDFVDIDIKTSNICPLKLEEKLLKAKSEKKLPKILIPVHLSGNPCDMKKISSLCKEHGVKIIEDASHAIGATYYDRKIGSCDYSDITVFSFHPVKIITTGEGGAALTNKDNLAKKMEILRTHGITRDQKMMEGDSHGPWYYQQIDLGFNYRMTDIHAALGITQLKRIEDFISLRHKVATNYDKMLKDMPINLPYQLDNTKSSLHLYVIRLKLEKIQITHKQFFEGMRSKGIGVNLHYIPVHLHPYYKKLGFRLGDFPEAEKYYSEAVSIPIFPNLSSEDQNKVVETISSLLYKK